VLELTPEIEEALREQAARLGTTPEILAQKALRDQFAAPPDRQSDASDMDAWKPFIGRFHSGKGDLSENTGDRFSEIVAAKRRGEGRAS